MKKFIFLSLLLVLNPHVVLAQSTTVAILQQTAIQTIEHIKRLEEAIKTVQLLQSQVKDTQDILNLAIKASEGIDGVKFVSGITT